MRRERKRLREERRQTYEDIIQYTIISLIKRAFDFIRLCGNLEKGVLRLDMGRIKI